MNKSSTGSGVKMKRVETEDPHLSIVPYSSKYPQIFQAIRSQILEVIPYKIEVEHVGSTAVPGLGGRNIIDVLILTEREHLEETAKLLGDKGFKINPQSCSQEKLFVSGPFKHNNERLHVHIHITFVGSKEYTEKIMLRDYLIKHPDEAEKYYRLKKQWMRQAKDISEYAGLKTLYINEVLRKAKEKAPSGRI